MIIYIDDKACDCEKGEYLLHVAARNGIYIPRYCHHDGLPGQACCRVCIVEVETGDNRRQVVTSCVYPVEGEIRVFTGSEKIRKQRAMVLALLHARAPESPKTSAMLKYADGSVPERFVRLGGEKCIVCGLCARACESMGTGAISTMGRGIDKRVSTPYDEPAAACVGCGSCAAVCPTEAISLTEDGQTRRIWEKTFALAQCEQCGATMGTAEELAYATNIAGAPREALCGDCRRKAVADVMAATFGA